MSEALDKARLAHSASKSMRQASLSQRNHALTICAKLIGSSSDEILRANNKDLERARACNLPQPLIDRLLLTPERLDAMKSSLLQIAAQSDPLGQIRSGHTLENGIQMQQITVPLGVVAIIYEARPNVTVDAFALCLKSGNACILKGGSAARESCSILARVCQQALAQAGLPQDAVQYIESTDHSETEKLMGARGLVDVLIPRGSARLIQSVVRHAQVPTIETGVGNCHVYLHKSLSSKEAISNAVSVVVNAKTSRPGVCNAAESLLVDTCVAPELLPPVLRALADRGVELVGDARAIQIAQECNIAMQLADEKDWATEYLDLKMSVHCVADIDEAIEHINRYGTGHSEAILAQDYNACQKFLTLVDAAAVYANASTRFTDGGEFGLGGEIGISTQKLHARGPFAAAALTTTKYILRGQGQIR